MVKVDKNGGFSSVDVRVSWNIFSDFILLEKFSIILLIVSELKKVLDAMALYKPEAFSRLPAELDTANPSRLRILCSDLLLHELHSEIEERVNNSEIINKFRVQVSRFLEFLSLKDDADLMDQI
jgi:hypothetical protein